MKTITIDGIEYQLTPIATEAPKPVQWEPKQVEKDEEYFSLSLSGYVKACVEETDLYDAGRASFGNYFHTEQEAEEAAKQVRQLLRLRAYIREFAPDWKADWNNGNQHKWHVTFDESIGRWSTFTNRFLCTPTTVYMPEEVAEELARKLNSGEVVL